MRLPRDWGGEELARLLRRCGYEVTRQTGSQLEPILTLLVNGLCSLPDNAVLVLDDYHFCPKLTSNLKRLPQRLKVYYFLAG